MEVITLQEHSATLGGLRIERTKRHQLLAIIIITITLCTNICGADTWVVRDVSGLAQWHSSA